ncbi:MAG: hypothetical protein WB611_05485 [Stellaceae bacterium]
MAVLHAKEDRRISKAWLHRSNNCGPSPGPVELAAIHDWGLLNPIATVPEVRTAIAQGRQRAEESS